MSDIEDYAPGSPEAIERGCTCDPIRNARSAGTWGRGERGPLYVPDKNCPMHGLEALRRVVAEEDETEASPPLRGTVVATVWLAK